MSGLGERLQAKALLLGERATREMYEDPFWQARFGARGREQAEKDSQFHLSYLLQALAAQDPAVFENYARWLQTLLVSRGMCSRHIDENFARLARAIEDEIDGAEAALDVLRAGREALLYPEGPARELQQLAEPLADRTLEVVTSRQPSWFSLVVTHASMAAFESAAQAEQTRFKRDVRDHIAYLADALHAGRAELFADHAVWTQDFQSRRQAPPRRVEETLLALDECLGPTAPSAEGETNPPRAARGASIAPAKAAGSDSVPPPARASLRPARKRPSLSPPPDAPVPVPATAELCAASRQLIERALERLAQQRGSSAGPSGAPPAVGGQQQ